LNKRCLAAQQEQKVKLGGENYSSFVFSRQQASGNLV